DFSPEIRSCPAILSGIQSRSNETATETVSKGGRMSLPVFKRRLLCALREWRQGNPPLVAHDGPRVSATRSCVVKRGTKPNRSYAGPSHMGGTLRSLSSNDPAPKAEND